MSIGCIHVFLIITNHIFDFDHWSDQILLYNQSIKQREKYLTFILHSHKGRGHNNNSKKNFFFFAYFITLYRKYYEYMKFINCDDDCIHTHTTWYILVDFFFGWCWQLSIETGWTSLILIEMASKLNITILKEEVVVLVLVVVVETETTKKI